MHGKMLWWHCAPCPVEGVCWETASSEKLCMAGLCAWRHCGPLLLEVQSNCGEHVTCSLEQLAGALPGGVAAAV